MSLKVGVYSCTNGMATSAQSQEALSGTTSDWDSPSPISNWLSHDGHRKLLIFEDQHSLPSTRSNRRRIVGRARYSLAYANVQDLKRLISTGLHTERRQTSARPRILVAHHLSRYSISTGSIRTWT
ncbi:hypothetical protein AFLA_011586 [Aspergillus flavus NRRL3357]|nr:hypothetical protein AFLA_011586 [Aspergillus flavus NRRL3357]